MAHILGQFGPVSCNMLQKLAGCDLGQFLRIYRNWVWKLAGCLPRASRDTKGLPPTESLLIFYHHHSPLVLTICPACQFMRHIALCNSLRLLLVHNRPRLRVSHSRIGSGSTLSISCVDVAPLHHSLEPSLPILVAPGMKEMRTNVFLHVNFCLKTWA